MSALFAGSSISPSQTLFNPPIDVAITAAPFTTRQGLGWGPFIWDFDISGSAFNINTEIAIRPFRFYAIYFEFTITVDLSATALTDSVMNLSWRDFTGLMAIPVLMTIPINQFTVVQTTDPTVRCQLKYAGNVTLFSEYLPPNPNAPYPGLTWSVNLVDATTGLAATAGTTKTQMEIVSFYVQDLGGDAVASQTNGLNYGSKRKINVTTH